MTSSKLSGAEFLAKLGPIWNEADAEPTCFAEGHDLAVVESYACGPERWAEILECRRCGRRVTKVDQVGEEATDVNYAVAIIVTDGDRVLMVRNAKRNGSVEIPGGALRSDESIPGGAARELLEECGLRVELQDLEWFHVKEVRGWRVHVWRALRWSGELRAGDDATDCFFGDPELLLTGARSEDYETVGRAMCLRNVRLSETIGQAAGKEGGKS